MNHSKDFAAKHAHTPLAVVTGSSSGIGLAIAHRLAGSGWSVLGVDIRAPEEAIPGVITHQVDITSPEAVAHFASNVLAEHGQLDALINNAGVASAGAIEECSEEEINQLFDVTFHGTVRMVAAFLPSMREQRNGRIVNISSGAALVAEPFTGFYSAAKAAIVAYTQALRFETQHLGIKVSVVLPGFTATNIAENSPETTKSLPDYSEPYARVHAFASEKIRTGQSPDAVAMVVEKVVTERGPRFRYLAGKEVRQSYWSQKFLPERLYERLVRSYYKLS